MEKQEMNSTLEVSRISLNYGGSCILNSVDFKVKEGEFYIIIGPNGAGKTTILKSIAGLCLPTSGSIDITGRPLSDYSRRKLARKIAFVQQEVTGGLSFTVRETVLMGRTPHLGLLGLEGREDHALAEEAMRFTDVTHLQERQLSKLSGGERQRVVIARAICQQSEIILLDEPTSSLDPAHQLKIMDLMERLRIEKGITVVMVSHDLNLAAMYGTRLLLLKAGSVVQEGRVDEVMTEELLQQTYGCRMQVEVKAPLRVKVSLIPEKYC
jgi:iron complex transport system ATP-binding protein